MKDTFRRSPRRQRQCIRRFMSRLAFSASSNSSVLLLVLLVAPWSQQHYYSLATEIQATNEWTLLGDNDTIDSGMHVRLDLEKGERWVKLINEDEDDNDAAMQLVEVTTSGAAQFVEKKDDSKPLQPKSQHMDYDMMHRTLSKLPDEDQQRMQLPHYVDKSDTTNRPAFEAQMHSIWQTRQEELRQFEQVDLPTVLKERVQQLQNYFESDAVDRLERIDLDREHEIGVMDPADIVSVLHDLEYHLTDIDMTRDFYTLGGWPVLVSLLDSNVHLVNATTNSLTTSNSVLAKMDTIQLYTAWCIGSAVKNQEEFWSYAMVPIVNVHTKAHTTTLELLTDQIDAFSSIEYDFSQVGKLNKYLYALGALLRGNREAQGHFCAEYHGASRLGQLLSRAMELDTGPSRKVAIRLLTLADDIVSDTRLHASASPQVDTAIAAAFTSEIWCDAALEALSRPAMRTEMTLKAVQTRLPHCKTWTQATVMKVLVAVQSTWENQAEEVDPEVQRDRMKLISVVMEESTYKLY